MLNACSTEVIWPGTENKSSLEKKNETKIKKTSQIGDLVVLFLFPSLYNAKKIEAENKKKKKSFPKQIRIIVVKAIELEFTIGLHNIYGCPVATLVVGFCRKN